MTFCVASMTCGALRKLLGPDRSASLKLRGASLPPSSTKTVLELQAVQSASRGARVDCFTSVRFKYGCVPAGWYLKDFGKPRASYSMYLAVYSAKPHDLCFLVDVGGEGVVERHHAVVVVREGEGDHPHLHLVDADVRVVDGTSPTCCSRSCPWRPEWPRQYAGSTCRRRTRT